MSKSNWPEIPKALMEKLLEAFPPTPYDVKKSHNWNIQESGKQALVQFLKTEYERQQASGPIPPLN